MHTLEDLGRAAAAGGRAAPRPYVRPALHEVAQWACASGPRESRSAWEGATRRERAVREDLVRPARGPPTALRRAGPAAAPAQRSALPDRLADMAWVSSGGAPKVRPPRRPRGRTSVPMLSLDDSPGNVIVSGPPKGTPNACYWVRWDDEHFASRGAAEAHIRTYTSTYNTGRYVPKSVREVAGQWVVEWNLTLEPESGLEREALEEFWTRPAARTAPATPRARAPGAAPPSDPTRLAPPARAHPGQLTTSWASPLPHMDRLRGPDGHYLAGGDGATITAHSPTGRCLAELSADRLAILWRWYCGAHADGDPSHKDFVSDFALQVATCAAYYSDKRLGLHNHWSTPPGITAALAAVTGADTERFSSPVNASPAFSRHYSLRREDAAFGFEYDAYSVRFQGPWYMNPMYDAEELARSLRWAVASASADPSPNMGIAIIPRYARAAHTSVLGARGRHDVMMGTPGVHVLTTLEKGFRFLPQDAWKGGPDSTTGTKFMVDIVLIYNEAGRLAHGSGLTPDGPLALSLAANYGTRVAFREPPALAAGRGPRVGSRAPAGCSLLKRWPPGFKGVPREAPARALDPVPREPPPVVGEPPAGRWAGWEVVYTDGSKAEGPRAGAGVYWPDAEDSVHPPAAPAL